MKWHRGLPFLFALALAIVAAEETPSDSPPDRSTLIKWRQPAYDDLLRSYKVDENKTNPYTKSQRYRVYDIPDEEKVFVNGTWRHPNYNRIRKKDRETSKRKSNGAGHDALTGLKLAGLAAATAAADAAISDIGDDEPKAEKSSSTKPKHNVGRDRRR